MPGVVVSFIAKADEARRDVLDFAKSLGKVDTAVTDTDRKLDTLGTGFDQAAADARQAATKIEAAARDMGSGVAAGADDVNRETSSMRTQMGETGKEAGAEFIGNIAEGIGSGQVKVTDVVSGTLGGITNLAATLTGPLGIAVAGAAAGVGLVFAAVKGESERAKKRVDELSGALEELGTTSGKAAKQVIWDTWLKTMGDSKDELNDIVRALDTAGISQEKFRDAMTGSVSAQEEIKEHASALGRELIKQQVAGEEITEEQRHYLQNFDKIIAQIDDQNHGLGDTQEYFDSLDWLSGKTKTNIDKTGKSIDDATDKAKGLGKELDEATADKTVRVKWDVDKLPRHLGGSIDINATAAGGLAIGIHAPAPAATATVTAPVPASFLVTEEQLYRAVAQLLLRGAARNGRPVLLR